MLGKHPVHNIRKTGIACAIPELFSSSNTLLHCAISFFFFFNHPSNYHRVPRGRRQGQRGYDEWPNQLPNWPGSHKEIQYPQFFLVTFILHCSFQPLAIKTLCDLHTTWRSGFIRRREFGESCPRKVIPREQNVFTLKNVHGVSPRSFMAGPGQWDRLRLQWSSGLLETLLSRPPALCGMYSSYITSSTTKKTHSVPFVSQ